MPKRSTTLDLVDSVTGAARAAGTSSGAMQAQAAFVRALVDEVERHDPSDRGVAALHEQLGDELVRLARLVGEADGTPRGKPRERVIDVLVVDDEEGSRTALESAIKSLGYACRAACDGEAALREFEKKPAAVVIADWNMPGLTGLELCMALKHRRKQPYFILVTGFHDRARLLDGMRGGADDFMRKPIDIDELEVRLLAGTRLLRAVDAMSELHERLRDAEVPGEPRR